MLSIFTSLLSSQFIDAINSGKEALSAIRFICNPIKTIKPNYLENLCDVINVNEWLIGTRKQMRLNKTVYILDEI